MDPLILLNAATASGLKLTVDGDRLIVRGPKKSAHVVETLAKHKATLLAYLTCHATEQPVTATVTPMSTTYTATLPVEAGDLIGWFKANRDRLPSVPFRLNAWTFVSSPETFFSSLNRDIGGSGARAGGLAADIRDLKLMLDSAGHSG